VIDINLLRENPDVFRASQRARGKDETHVDRILEADAARRALIGEYETLRAEQNAFGKKVAKAPKEEKPALVAQAKELAARVNDAKAASEAKTAEYEELISSIENLIIDGVPTGGEDDYVVVKVPRFTFEKFPAADPTLTTSMKAVGEAMAIGRSFTEALQKALRSIDKGGVQFHWDGDAPTPEETRALIEAASVGTEGRLVQVQQAIRGGATLEELFESTKIDPWFLDQMFLLDEVATRIREAVGLPASVGIAATKSVAKIASSHAKPDGLLLIPKDATVEFLHGLPVGALWGVGGRTGAILDREGIDTIGDLAHTTITRLTKLLGVASAHHLHDLSWGIDPRAVSTSRPEKSVGMERTFEEDVRSRADIEEFILAASHDCARRLRAGRAGGGALLPRS